MKRFGTSGKLTWKNVKRGVAGIALGLSICVMLIWAWIATAFSTKIQSANSWLDQ